MPAFDSRLARRHLALAGHQHLAHQHVLDLVGRNAGTLESCLDRQPTEICRTQRGECASQLADRRTGSGDDVRTCHGGAPV